jgi:hypothetical protein
MTRWKVLQLQKRQMGFQGPAVEQAESEGEREE